MKKLFLLLSAIFITTICSDISAQKVNINININVDKQPSWGPIGYDYAPYYYFPEIDIYYDVNREMFYYPSGSRWVCSRYLPLRYRKYNFYALYKVVIKDHNPWHNHKHHKKHYKNYRDDRTQICIRDSRDKKYNNSRNNHKNWIDPKREHYNDKNYNRPNYVEKETHLSSGRNDKGSNHDRVKDNVKLNSRNPEKQSQKSNSRNSSRADKTDTNKNARTTRN